MIFEFPNARFVAGLLTLLFWLSAGTVAQGQGSEEVVTVLDTIPGEALISEARPVSLAPVGNQMLLQFKVGFGTDEVFGPGTIFDAFSLTLQAADFSRTWVLATFDASGVVWAPATPGTEMLEASSIGRASITTPSFLPDFGFRQAYALEMALPEGAEGQPLQLYFDLFNNQNQIASQGWFTDIVIVPEPGVMALVAVGLAMLWWLRRRRVGRHRIGAWLVLLGVSIFPADANAQAEQVFVLNEVSVTLVDVTPDAAVYYSSMRLNRALNVWNVEMTVSNRSAATLSGPVVVLVEGFTGTSGLQGFDGTIEGGKRFLDLGAQMTTRGLAPGQKTSPRTLTLGRTGTGSPVLTTRVFAARPPASVPLGLTRTLNEVGQPLPSVTLQIAGPTGAARQVSDRDSGVSSFGQTPGAHTVMFSREGYLPVWRRQALATNEPVIFPNPRLSLRSAEAVSATPLGGVILSNSTAGIRIEIPAGALSQAGAVTLTPLSGQTLPAFLPLGWSPLSAFWVESSSPIQAPLNAMLRPLGAIAGTESAVLARWDETTLQWIVMQSVPGNGTNAVTTRLPAVGAYALIVADTGEWAPPAVPVGQPLAGASAPSIDSGELTASGNVTPSASPASVVPALVTGTARLEVRHSTRRLPSGYVLRGEVTETYLLSDGSLRLIPQYEHFIVAYQRPGDQDAFTLHASFPMRPVLVFGPAQLDSATVKVDVLPESAFDGEVLDQSGGQIGDNGVRVLAGTGRLVGPSAVQLRRLDAAVFTNLVGSGHTVIAAFDLTVDRSTLAGSLSAQLGGAPTNAQLVMARVLSATGFHGLQPIERLRSDSLGNITSLEPATGTRLPGLAGSGQFVLVQVNEAQTLVEGVARNGAGNVQSNMPVSLVGLPWLTLSGVDGTFQLVGPAGERQLSIRDPLTGDAGFVGVTVGSPTTPVTQDLSTAARGPRVAKISPADNATRVPRVGSVVIEFNEAVNPASIVNAIQLLRPDDSAVPASVTLNLANRVVTLTAANELAANTTYRVQLAETIRDPSGLAMEGDREFSFTTVPAATRVSTAQLVIYEPGATNVPAEILNGIPAYEPGNDPLAIVVHGQPGVADPEVAVILANESTGETTTVLSRVDGGFSSVISGTEEDFISATFVNLNGTRVYVPVSRQEFDNGFVGLYPQGGILEAQSDGGPVKVIIEPGTIPSRTKLRMKAPSAAELVALLGDTRPEVAAQLARPMIFEGDGQPLTGPIKVSFTVNLASVGYTNADPLEAAIALVQVTDTDGVKAFQVMDQMKFEPNTGMFRAAAGGPDQVFFGVVNSVIGLVPQASIANNVFRYALMPILLGGKPIVVKGRVIQSIDIPQLADPFKANDPLLQAFKFEQLGSAFKPIDQASQAIGSINNANTLLTDLLQGRALGGALVTLQNIFTPGIPGKLRSGMVYSTSDRDGGYLMVAPTTPWLEIRPGDFFLVMATHPRFREKQSETLFALQDMSIAGVAFKNFVFREPLALQVPPVVNVAHAPPYPAAGDSVEVQVNAAQGFQGNPEVNVFVEQVFPAGQQISDVKILNATSTTDGNRTRWSGRIQATNTIRRVVLRVSAIPSAGEPKVVRYPISFTGAPEPAVGGIIPPSDPNEKKGPSVAASFPVEGGLASDGGEITLVFNEPIDRRVETDLSGILLNPETPGAAPAVRLSADQTVLTLQIAGLLSDKDYTLSVSGASVMDLNGNPLDQRPSTAETEAFSLTFKTPPLARANLPGMVNGAGSVIHGARLYAIDNTTPPMLRIYDISKPEAPKLLGTARVVGTPRDLVVLPNYSYRLNLHDPTRTGDLVAVVGGDLDAVVDDLDSVIVKGQYLRVFEVADPANPVEIAAPIVSFRVGSAVTKVRWHAPNLVYQEFGADLHQLAFVDLQEHLIGRHAKTGEADTFPTDGREGKDNNGDGDYTDDGETFPLPQRRPAEFYGKKQSYVISGSTQRMLDFSVAGGTVGVTLTGGFGLTQGGQVDTGRAVMPQYRTLAFNGIEIVGATVDFAAGDYPGRVTVLDGLPVEDNGRLYTPIVALVSLSPDRLGSNRLLAFDISLPLSPKLIGDIQFPNELSGGQLRSVVRREDGLLELSSVSHVFHIDSRRLSLTNPPSGLHPAVVGYFPAAGGRMRSTGTSLSGVRSAVEGGRNEIVQSAPHLSFVNFPLATEIIDPRHLEREDEAVQALMSRSQLVENLVPARVQGDHLGHTSDLFPANPEVHYHVLIEAPGGAGETIKVGLESLSKAGWPLPNKGSGFPPVRATDGATISALGIVLREDCDATIRPLLAYRLSNDQSSPHFNRYLSRPFVVVYEAMSAAELNLRKLEADREILWSGSAMRAFIDPTEQVNTPIGPFAARVDVPRGVIFPVASATAHALDVSYAMGPNPPPPGGDVRLPGTFSAVSAHSGEVRTEAVDIGIPSPRMPIAIQRTIGGQDTYEGPFGLGWDFNYNQRVTELQPQLFPAGFKMPLIARAMAENSVVGSSKDLLFHTGVGRVVLFEWRGDSMPAEYAADPLVDDLNYDEVVADYFLPEPGVFDLLVKFKDGKYERLTPDGVRFRYASNGRLETIIDRFPANRHEMEYDRRGWLRRIDDRAVTDDRFVEFGFYRRDNDADFVSGLDERSENSYLLGKICRVRDYAGRDVLYRYDDEGLLILREGIKVDGENGGFSGRNQTHYNYQDCRFVGVAVGPNKVLMMGADARLSGAGVPVSGSTAGVGGATTTAVPPENTARILDGLRSSATQADGRVTDYTFNAYGHPKSIQVSGPNTPTATILPEYNLHGQLTLAQYPEGRVQRITYDSANPIFRSRGNVIRIEVDAGPRGGASYAETFGYDPYFNLPSGAQSDANGFTITHALTADRRAVQSVQHGDVGAETFTYNVNGQVTGRSDYDGIETSADFSSANGFLVSSKIGNHQTRYSYSGLAGKLGQPGETLPPRGTATTVEYNSMLQPTRVVRGDRTKRMAYDAQGREFYREDVMGDGKRSESWLAINEIGFVQRRVVTGIEVNGSETSLETIYLPDEVFRVGSILHPGGSNQKFFYNALGHRVRMELESYAEDYETDLHGNILSVKKGGDVVARTDFDGLDRPKTTYILTGTQEYVTDLTRFPGGQLRSQKTTDPTFGVVQERVVNEIDALGRVKSSTTPGDFVSRTDTVVYGIRERTTTGPRQTVTEQWNTAGHPTRYLDTVVNATITTDGNGNIESVTRAEDNASYQASQSYNELDQQLTVSDNLGLVSTITPRADGSPLSVRNARNNTTTFEHSALGELLRRRRPDGMEFRFRHDEQRQVAYSGDPTEGFDFDYDKLFRMTHRTQRDGAEIKIDSFDPRNQPTSITTPGGALTMTYDRQARVKTSTAAFGSTTYQTSSDYDALNRVRVVNYQQNGGTANRALYTYDKAGPLREARFDEDGTEFVVGYTHRDDFARSRITYPSGFVLNQERDASGRLMRIHGTVEDVATVTEWEGRAQPRSINFGGVLRADHRYDSRGRVVGSRYVRTPGGALQAEMRFQFDAANNVEMRQFLHRAGKTDNFSYDNGERLVRAQVGGIPLEGGTDVSRPLYQRAYNYESTGLDYLLTAPVTGVSAPPAPFATNWTGHNAFLLPGSVDGSSRGAADALGRVANARLWPRAVGGTAPAPVAGTLQHNGLGQLVRIEREDGLVIENFFQPGGLRYARKATQGGSVLEHRHYVYDNGGRLLEEFDRTGAQPVLLARYFYFDSDAPCAVDLPDSNGVLRRHYYIYDEQHSVVAVTDRFGVVEERVWYDPFGQAVIEPRDDTAPVVKRVIAGAGGTLLIEMSEPVSHIVFDLGPQSGIRRFNSIDTDLVSLPAGLTDFPDQVPGYAPFTVIVFTPEEPLSGAVDLRIRPGNLTDDWDNHVAEQTIRLNVTGVAGATYYNAGNPVTDAGTVARSTIGSPMLWHGQYFDYDTGLVYLRARFFDPYSGMFFAPDPLGYEDSVNLYAGIKNNPTSVRDPSGLKGLKDEVLDAVLNTPLGRAISREVSQQLNEDTFGGNWGNTKSYSLNNVSPISWKFVYSVAGALASKVQGPSLRAKTLAGVWSSGWLIGSGGDQLGQGLASGDVSQQQHGATDMLFGGAGLSMAFYTTKAALAQQTRNVVAAEAATAFSEMWAWAGPRFAQGAYAEAFTIKGGITAGGAALGIVATAAAGVSLELARQSIHAGIEGRETPVDVAWNYHASWITGKNHQGGVPTLPGWIGYPESIPQRLGEWWSNPMSPQDMHRENLSGLRRWGPQIEAISGSRSTSAFSANPSLPAEESIGGGWW